MLRLPIRSLSARITAVVIATVLLIGGGSFWVLQDFYRRQMIDSLAQSTAIEGKLVEQSLRYAMHSRSLDHLGEMVRRLADHKSVENVMILNKKGAIRFSSNPADRGRVLARTDPTCAICHKHGLSVHGRTVIFETGDNHRVFRNVNPILNSESCHECHSSEDRVNGVLIVDYSMAGIDASLEASARKMWLSAITLALAITGVIVIAMRRVVLRRIRALVTVVDSIEAGNLDPSADVRGADEIDLLSNHLNRMTRSLDHSLRSLRERESFLDAVINSADDGIVVVDENLRIVKANRAFKSLGSAGDPKLALAHCECAGMCTGDDIDACAARMTFRTGEVTRRIRTIDSQGNGLRHFEISASPLRSASGSPQVIEIWRDITQRREFEAHLASQERLASLGLLASGVSHEINNPLASITTCLDGLRRRLRACDNERVPEELPEYLDLIRGEVGRCQSLTERLKVLGRTPQPVREPVELSAVVRDTLALVRYECRKSQVEIDLATDGCAVLADQTQIRQVILNIVLNAIQAIDGPGRLIVRVEPAADGFVRFEVIDTGHGIEAADLSKVFEPFYSARPDGKGTGLGLFISRIIVDNLGGSIRVSSAPGSGTTFTVLLPAASATVAPVES